ncbi:hypothetical protein BpHYR1_017707 [Brachionus plicatilis]|uniref:Uncharacterized protein n=1 Tax=Brachionus plicatilis TaxID=10195 RepID=A0A3M7PR13_BRAPC|nr:hypothetical protein BpHYR1_017707 [Brachionus plicatilis]
MTTGHQLYKTRQFIYKLYTTINWINGSVKINGLHTKKINSLICQNKFYEKDLLLSKFQLRVYLKRI